MKRTGIVALVFILGCATGGVAAQLVVPPVRAGASPTRWEYQCVSLEKRGRITSALNKLGSEGWELASVAPAHHATVFGNSDVDEFMLCAKRALP